MGARTQFISLVLTLRNQLIGWVIFGAFNLSIQGLLGIGFKNGLVNSAIAVLAGLPVTTAFSYLLCWLPWARWRIWKVVGFVLVGSFLMALAWIFLINLIASATGVIDSLDRDTTTGNLINGTVVFIIWNLFTFVGLYLFRLKETERIRWQLSNEVREAQLANLRAQIRPHFVFNTLNNIKALVVEDPERARDMILHFSELLRYSLTHDEQELVTLSEELNLSKQYLELVGIQYDQRLSWSMEASPEARATLLPPMLLQLLVENAVKHGVALQPGQGEVRVYAEVVENELTVSVRNNGVIDAERQHNSPDVGTGNGLAKLRQRLKLQYGDSAFFDLRESPPYVYATLRLPRQNS